MRKKLKNWASEIKGKVLDVGAGNQPYRKYLNVSEYIATNTKRHYQDPSEVEGLTDVWIDDASQLPFDDNEFDSVVCFQVLSVVKDPELFFQEINRVLKPGGTFLITTDWLYPTWSNEDKARYASSELEVMMMNSGLKPTGMESFGGIRSLIYMQKIRWILGYPGRIKNAKGILKLARIFRFIYYLDTMPLRYFQGLGAFIIERNVNDNLAQSFNLLAVAKKPS